MFKAGVGIEKSLALFGMAGFVHSLYDFDVLAVLSPPIVADSIIQLSW